MKSRLYAACVAALFGSVLAASPAVADCNPDTALFDDDFEFMDGSWGQPDDNIFVEDGVFVIKGGYGKVNFQTNSEAADICVDATIAEAADLTNTAAWVIFWWQDWDNYYSVGYWGDGSLQIDRKVKGKWLSVAYVKSLPAIKPGVGQTNHIELNLTSKDVTVSINGTQVNRFKGKPPKGGGPVGLMSTEPEGKPTKITFDNLVVSEPAAQ